MDLSQLRTNIDALDDQIMDLIRQRFLLVQQVKDYKKMHQIPVLDASREQDILMKLQGKPFGPQLSAIYDTLFKVSKQLQE